MTNGFHPELTLDLARWRGAELRAEAQRYRLARQARACAARVGAGRVRPARANAGRARAAAQ
jgi:hypothetical protein